MNARGIEHESGLLFDLVNYLERGGVDTYDMMGQYPLDCETMVWICRWLNSEAAPIRDKHRRDSPYVLQHRISCFQDEAMNVLPEGGYLHFLPPRDTNKLLCWAKEALLILLKPVGEFFSCHFSTTLPKRGHISRALAVEKMGKYFTGCYFLLAIWSMILPETRSINPRLLAAYSRLVLYFDSYIDCGDISREEKESMTNEVKGHLQTLREGTPTNLNSESDETCLLIAEQLDVLLGENPSLIYPIIKTCKEISETNKQSDARSLPAAEDDLFAEVFGLTMAKGTSSCDLVCNIFGVKGRDQYPELGVYIAAFVQIMDDIQDVEEDMADGSTTLPILLLKKGYLDGLLLTLLTTDVKCPPKRQWLVEIMRALMVLICANIDYAPCYFSASLYSDLSNFRLPETRVISLEFRATL